MEEENKQSDAVNGESKMIRTGNSNLVSSSRNRTQALSSISSSSQQNQGAAAAVDAIHAAFQHLLLLTSESGEYVDVGFQGNMIAVRTCNSSGRTEQYG